MTPVVTAEEGARHVELADEAMAAFDAEAAIEHLSAAIRAFTTAGDNRAAALACARLGDLFGAGLRNTTAARAWFLRATRLLEDEPLCLEQGWVAVMAMGCDIDDPEVLLANAELALDRARRFGDVNLEAKALADGGLAHVQAGRVTTGMAMLDEAMALVCGPGDDIHTAGKSVCSFFTACYFACDFDRVGPWADLLRRRGLMGPEAGAPVFVASHCQSVQAALLVELGQWSDAERVLETALIDFEETMSMPAWHPNIELAELRIRQGRLTDAEQLLLGRSGSMQALLPSARLHLARGDVDLARATAARGLKAVGDDRLRGAELLALLVDIEVTAGDVEAAAQRCADLAERAVGLEVPALTGRIAGTRARALAASGDTERAIEAIESGLDAVQAANLPFLRATLLVDLARLHQRVGDRAAARVEAERADSLLRTLDVVVADADRRLLEELISDGERPAPAKTAILAPDARGWTIEFDGTTARLRSSKGMSYLAELVRHAGTERHALDLVDLVEGLSADGVDRRSLGDAGELIDARARDDYRRRIEALHGEIEEALTAGAEQRAMERQDELDALTRELARAFGVGGRERRAGSAAERARLNVTRSLRTAVTRVQEVAPQAGDVLDRGLRTGLYCAFEPEPGEAVRWIVHS
jgi:tetratricopeptide (TPR) repeat protein